MRALGVGMVWWQELAPLFAAPASPLSVLELEPQTLWERSTGGAGSAPGYRVNHELLAQVARLPQARLVHGVGHPLAGLVDDPLDWAGPLRRCIGVLRPAWASEHLAFNRFRNAAGGVEQTSFLLPPRQTAAGVQLAALRLARFSALAGVPVAFETGVNYLQPRADEIGDGEYFAAVAEAADCGIVLDLHNLWVNAKNGRQSLAAALDALPLERVWELHLAGGHRLDGVWLDAHDRLASDELLALAAELVPRLPALGAIVFEVLPAYVPGIGLERIADHVGALWSLWRQRRPAELRLPVAGTAPRVPLPTPAALRDIADWERGLGSLALGHEAAVAVPGLADDPGIGVLRQLVREFRSGRVTRVLRYTMLALLRGLGADGTRRLVEAYCRSCSADVFNAGEADRFASFLRQRIGDGRLALPLLDEVLAFEHAMVSASLFDRGATLRWSVDPVALFEALENGSPLAELPRVPSEMTIAV